MKQPVRGSDRQPGFLWQALLILLPVVLLTSAGLWALQQDRRLVEQDARDRATETLRTLGPLLESKLPSALWALRFEDATNLFLLWEGRAPRVPDLRLVEPEVGLTELVPNGTSNAGRVRENATTASGPVGSSRRKEALFSCRWDVAGRLLDPLDYADPPSPAAWLTELDAPQRTAWNQVHQIQTSEDAETKSDDALNAFLALDPPESAQIAARFLALQLHQGDAGDAGKPQELLNLIQAHPAATTAAGIPLMAIATGTLLANPEATDHRSLLLKTLRACVLESPSALTPVLLRRALADAQAHAPQTTEALTELGGLWENESRLRQLAHRLRRQFPDHRSVGTAWLQGPAGSWLATFGPPRLGNTGDTDNSDAAMGSVAFLMPQQSIERALYGALEARAGDWPAYAGLHLTVADHTVSPPGLSTIPATQASNTPVLAVIDITLNQLGENAGDRQLADGELPAPLTFQLALHLTDPTRLYTRQAQRARVFGGLILAAAAAAIIGLIGAYRAFRRQLRLAELKSNFVSSVSHELRAPIASVQLLAESLERNTVSEDAKRQEYFRLIGQECRRLSGLIENVLDFSRIDQGRKRYEFEPTNLNALARETIRLMTPYAGERRVPLELDAPATDVEFTADGRALQQALVNLIDNAVKHSPAGKPVVLTLTAHETTICLSVTDQGPGIPDEDHQRIFEPFYRRGSELRRDTQGVGIGLSIVRHVVEAHEGRITVENTNPDHGTRFTIELPHRLQPKDS